MERNELLKLLVFFIVAMFLLSTFTYFGRGSASNGGNTDGSGNVTPIVQETGTAVAKGRITAYGEELVVNPWTSNLTAVFNKLKAAGQIEYVNVISNQGVLILSSNANTTAIRDEFLPYNVDVVGTATVAVNDFVNFTLLSGVQKPLFVNSDRVMIDPITPVGSELPLDITADITDVGIAKMQTTVRPMQSEVSFKGTMACSDAYRLESFVAWENRDVNLTQLEQQLNITSEGVEYTKADVVDFSRPLNDTELAAVKNLSALIVLKLIPEGILIPTNLVIKDIVKQSLDPALGNMSNISLMYPPSLISLEMNGNDTYALAKQKLAGLNFTNFSTQQGCTISVSQFANISEQTYIVDRNVRELNYFVGQNDIKDSVKFFGNATIIGSSITDFSFIGFTG